MAETPREPRPIAARSPRKTLPAVGDQVWYRLSSTQELVEATVIDHIPQQAPPPFDKQLLNPPRAGTLHLRIALDPERHFSSGPIGYRFDAPEAEPQSRTPNTWVRERPDDEDAWFEGYQREKLLEQEIRRRIMRGE